MPQRRSSQEFLRDPGGASAAEFVLILPGLILLVIGTINIGMMMYTTTALHFAVEDAARCATVKAASVCTNPTTTAAYAASHYGGPSAATFVRSSTACGWVVTGTTNYKFTTGLTNTTSPISATACYPLS
jgi:Flp pilus assembly protein TadG